MRRFTGQEARALSALKKWNTTDTRGLILGSLRSALEAQPGEDWAPILQNLETTGMIRATSKHVFFTNQGYQLMYPERTKMSGGGGMAVSQEHKRATRYKYLKALYEGTDGNELTYVDMFEIGRSVGLDQEATVATYEYLKNEGLAEAVALGGIIKITHSGVKEYEESLQNPDRPTQHFPSLNIVNNILRVEGSVAGSQIQQGSPHATINSQQEIDTEAVRHWLETLLSKLPEMELQAAQHQQILDSVDTIKALLQTRTPNRSFILQALGSIKATIENVAGNVAAALILGMPK
jgi:flavodoxin